jgi:hypothetical protein
MRLDPRPRLHPPTTRIIKEKEINQEGTTENTMFLLQSHSTAPPLRGTSGQFYNYDRSSFSAISERFANDFLSTLSHLF